MQWQILKTGLNSLCVTRRRDGKLQHLVISHADCQPQKLVYLSRKGLLQVCTKTKQMCKGEKHHYNLVSKLQFSVFTVIMERKRVSGNYSSVQSVSEKKIEPLAGKEHHQVICKDGEPIVYCRALPFLIWQKRSIKINLSPVQEENKPFSFPLK